MIFTGNNHGMFNDFKKVMTNEFEMTDICQMSYFLGVKVKQNKEDIFMSQKKYAEQILKKFGMEECKPVSTPAEPSIRLRVDLTRESALAEEAKARYQDVIFKIFDLVSLNIQIYKVYLYFLLTPDVDIDELESLRTRKKELEYAISDLEISVKVLQSEKIRNEDEAAKVQRERLYPSCILVLLLENPLIIFGRYRKDFPSTIQLKGVLADMRNFSIELKVQEAKDIPPDKIKRDGVQRGLQPNPVGNNGQDVRENDVTEKMTGLDHNVTLYFNAEQIQEQGQYTLSLVFSSHFLRVYAAVTKL
ncbi:hypothetical protein AgCh_002492 [Apium graveolens]